MRWIKSNFLLLLIYGVFTVAAWRYVMGCIRYAGVENWPSVEAKVTGESGELRSYPSQGSWGMKSSYTIDTRAVHFDYEVAGRKYKGDHFSPDGGLSGPWQDIAWRAYYKPAAPEIAVLHPKPFEGVGAFLWMSITGIMVVVHLWCGATDFLKRGRKAQKNRSGRQVLMTQHRGRNRTLSGIRSLTTPSFESKLPK